MEHEVFQVAVCKRNGDWKTENWIYKTFDEAYQIAKIYMQDDGESDANEAATVTKVTRTTRADVCRHIKHPTAQDTGWTWVDECDPWNWKQEDYFKGVRVRTREAKRHKIS